MKGAQGVVGTFVTVAALAISYFGLASQVEWWPFSPNGPITPNEQLSPIGTITPNEQPDFRVVEVFLRADPFDYSGPCPVTITFSGRISVVGSGTVSYRFQRSDGASVPVQALEFNSSGSQDVQNTWTLGGPGFASSDWQTIEVLDPAAGESEPATFTVACE